MTRLQGLRVIIKTLSLFGVLMALLLAWVIIQLVNNINKQVTVISNTIPASYSQDYDNDSLDVNPPGIFVYEI
jgi:hypothetical protein